jgi:hypothetical protein
MDKKFVIVVDTICDGWQALERDEHGNLIFYATEEEANKEIMDNNAVRDEPDEEPEEFVVPYEDYIEGRKTIYKGEQND